jgi:hypothetical protein
MERTAVVSVLPLEAARFLYPHLYVITRRQQTTLNYSAIGAKQ